MRSRAHIKGHPLHPMLIAFPIAFFTGTLLLDATAVLASREALLVPAYYLQAGGVLFGLLAAAAGIVDLLHTVPPRSSAKKRGVRHGLLNTLSLLLHAGIWWHRNGGGDITSGTLLLEGLAFGCMLVAGWMGGTLVYRNQIGVDPRYAGAGKWQELYPRREAGGFPVPEAAALKLNQMLLVHAEGKRIVVARTEEGLAAFDDRCTHKGGSLAGGSIACATVQCPWHGSQFHVRSGAAAIGPAKESIPIYPIEEKDGEVYLKL